MSNVITEEQNSEATQGITDRRFSIDIQKGDPLMQRSMDVIQDHVTLDWTGPTQDTPYADGIYTI